MPRLLVSIPPTLNEIFAAGHHVRIVCQCGRPDVIQTKVPRNAGLLTLANYKGHLKCSGCGRRDVHAQVIPPSTASGFPNLVG